MWRKFGGLPGPGDTAALIDGPGFDFDGLLTFNEGDLVIRSRDDTGGQRVPLEDLLWLLRNHGHLPPV